MARRELLTSAACATMPATLAGEGAVAATAERAVVFVIALHVKPGREEEFLGLLTPVLDAMRHEATFVNAVLHRDPEDPSRFMLYETWTDLDDVVQTQVNRDYRKAYLDRLPELLRAPREIQVWRPQRADFA
jgi:quinol monooxygenase YgiN